ncbi:hypothetical protein Tco_1218044 [Tanacetum coccineum]
MKSWPSIFLGAQAESSQPLINGGGGLDCQHGNPMWVCGVVDGEVFGVLWEVKQWQGWGIGNWWETTWEDKQRGPEFTWEREDQMQKKYPHLFTNSAPAAEVAS